MDECDWVVLKKTKGFLQALYDAALFTEGHYAILDRVLLLTFFDAIHRPVRPKQVSADLRGDVDFVKGC